MVMLKPDTAGHYYNYYITTAPIIATFAVVELGQQIVGLQSVAYQIVVTQTDNVLHNYCVS